MRGEELAAALREVVGAERVDNLRRLSGGASRETWSFDAVTGGGVVPLVLRRDPPGAPRSGMAVEARLFEVARRAGVPVPAVVAADDDPARLGSAFLVMERIEGETIPRKILRDDAFAPARPRMAAQCGDILARLHAADADAVPELEEADQVEQFRAVLDGLDQPHPMFELAFRWLDDNRPPSGPPVIVHGDFRNGNLVVGPDGVRAVLDWELAHRGDPAEDLGWLCARPWRFGAALPVGGFGTYDDLLEAYEATSGRVVDRDALHWWETLATLKWGVMCIVQAVTHTSGAVRSVELAAIGRRVCEVEWDLVGLLPYDFGPAGAVTASVAGGTGSGIDAGPVPDAGAAIDAGPVAGISDIPDAAGLVEAVREYLERDVMPATDGRVGFHARVATNVLRMVERELRAGTGAAAARNRALEALGFRRERDLATAIRSGAVGAEPPVLAYLRDSVEAKLRIANPAYLDRP